jgi:membrane dipeptidase
LDNDDEAREWYRAAPVADAHADSLLWNRDLAARSNQGHVDFPRMRDAGMRVQLFTIPTRGFPVLDGIRFFCWWKHWPRSARRDPRARALWQIEQMHAAVARSGGTVAIATTREDLEENLAKGKISAILGLEGAFPLEGNAKNLAQFWDRGVRFLGPAHLIPNEFSSCSSWLYRDRGLGAAGRELLQEMARLGAALDLSHASPRAVDQMLQFAPASLAVFDSHTGALGANQHWRNLGDDAMRKIAERGGVVAIILAVMYLGRGGMDAFLRHVAHAAKVAGPRAIAIGSDFDGFVALPREIRDVADYPRLAPALRGAGFDRAAVTGILGANLVDFLGRALPARKIPGAG